MIMNFASDMACDIYDGNSTKAARCFPRQLWKVAQRKLDMIQAAIVINDLRIPPGNRLESLKGDRKGQYSIRVNEQYRIVFSFHDGNAYNVDIVDYH